MWKFWTWDLWNYRARILEQSLLADHHRRREERLDTELRAASANMDRAEEEIVRLERKAEVMQKAAGVLGSVRTRPLPKPELLAALAGLQPESDLWRGLHAIIDDQRQIETSMVCEPDLSGELAHVRRGRLAAVLDLQATLIDLYAEAHRPKSDAGK